jgi:Tol biopolymer transport system component
VRKLAFSQVFLVLLLSATLLLVSVVEAGTWSSPSILTYPAFSGQGIILERQSMSGDGSKIAFMGYVDNASRIFVINTDGTELTDLTNDTEFNNAGYIGQPCISGDGSKIAFQYDDGGGWEIFMINTDGTELVQLTDSPNTGSVGSSNPSISDDGSKIAFFHVDFSTYNRGIFVINSDGTRMKQLTENFDRDFTMSGDGTKIAFLGGDDFDFQYFVINSDGTELRKLTQNTNEYQDINYNANPPYAPSISDDGSKIAFEGYVGSDREIFIINSDGTGLKQLTDNDEDDWAPAISGDGSRIAFQRTEYQKMTSNPDAIKPIKPQVYVINSDGTGLAQLTNKTEWAFWNPSISDNGEKIAFWSYFYDPEEIEPEKTGISLVNYLADAEDENDGGLIVPVAMVVGGILPLAIGVMVVAYLKKRKPW